MSAYEAAHELDERVVVAESVGPCAVEGHHQECPRRLPPCVEEPEVSSQPSNIRANGDDPLPNPLSLVLNSEGDEIGKVDDVPVPQGWWENRCLGVARIVGGCTGGQTVSALRGREIWKVKHCSIVSSRYVGSMIPKNSSQGSVVSRSRIDQPTKLILRQPSQCSSLQLKVEPKVFGKALLGALGGTAGEGDKFSRYLPFL
ncbi:hypothetical protein GOBAR_AA05422 [Gossypium barbadense]|uniref:Uncharacterized protein n=1 Tax=Gossypium barbadense TaxID=3634 RepID=A0A2P5YHU6_GOSBA|nr:hypothetical protein GOBAR_AA05422 [Gossypium barbadense]